MRRPGKKTRCARARAPLISAVLAATAYIATASPTAARNRPPIHFADKTKKAGLAKHATGSWGTLIVDHDRNGWPDLFVGRHGAFPWFFTNDSAHFDYKRYDFVSPPGYHSVDGDDWVDRHSCAWGEATGDDHPDLLCVVGANVGTSVGPNQLLVRTPKGFKDVARHYGLRDIWGRGRTVNWLDYDSDGDLDVYFGNWARDGHPSGLYKNQRRKFRRVHVGLDSQLHTESSSWADWDHDGDPDLLVMQYGGPTVAFENRHHHFVRTTIANVTGGSWHASAWGDYNADGWPDLALNNDSALVVLKNDHGHFKVQRRRSLAEGRATGWLDLENDGDLDLFVVQGAPGVNPNPDAVNNPDFLLRRANGGFAKIARRSLRGPKHGNGDTVSVADYDRDGRSDLFVTNGYFEYEQWTGKLRLLANRVPPQNSIGLDLNGGRWNPLGIDSTVRVRTSNSTYFREINDGVAFRTQSEVGHFVIGLGSAVTARIRVTWSDGSSDCAVGTAGATAAVRKGGSPCP